jgi:hypothetical protein
MILDEERNPLPDRTIAPGSNWEPDTHRSKREAPGRASCASERVTQKIVWDVCPSLAVPSS